MKKNTTKPTPSPAPVTKPVAAKPAAKKKSAPAPRAKSVAATPPPAPAPAPAPAPVPAAKPSRPAAAAPAAAPAPVAVIVPAVVPVAVVQPVAAKPVVTTISAQIDVGFGNAVYIRGEGAGLSWDAGKLMDCVSNNLWRITLGEAARGVTFKFLVNDLSWSTGPDYTAASGSEVTLTPEF